MAVDTRLRVGVRFEKVKSSERAALDRFVFALMKKKAAARARPGGGHERRVAPRVEIAESEDLSAELLPTRPLGALSRSATPAREPPKRFKVRDISTTGCSFVCPAGEGPRPGTLIGMRLRGAGIDVELQVKVIHAREG